MSNKSGASEVISVPKGGGALHGIGEKFSPDLHTGTGNFTVPLALPPGRSGFQPQLNLVYSTGNGNGPFGLGWNLSIPGVSRRTSKGVPVYDKAKDVFILSGAEDLVPVPGGPGATRYRPRTEGLFALIDHYRDASNDYWKVCSKDGLVSFYGTEGASGTDPAVIANPDPLKRDKVFAWKLTLTTDPFGNKIEYEYERDTGKAGPHHWDQLYLKRIRYADFADSEGNEQFLVSVTFDYGDSTLERPDSFSEYRAGFEIRTRRLCQQIVIRTHAGQDRLVRTYRFIYENDPYNGVSLLRRILVAGHTESGAQVKELPPLEFGYTQFQPEKRDFFPVTGADMPPASLSNPDFEIADLIGNGLPDILEMNGTVRYWRNLGGGRFDLPREMKDAPAGVRLADKGVQLIDANGDGRIDLLVTTGPLAGFYPMAFGGLWDHKSFQKYGAAPSFDLEDPEVKLVDLDGDGVTDAIRSGSRLECFFNDPHNGWTAEKTRWVTRESTDEFPDINFSDPRVKWADMTGDGLQDIVLIYDGNVEYWPNYGRGDWGKRISMRHSPHFPYGYDPTRILVGDVDGDGLADIVYVDDTKVTLWINQCGNAWSDPIIIQGTPPVSDMAAVRLADMLGSGISGVLWSSDAGGLSRESMFFLDFTGRIKPYVLHEMNNHMGAITKVEYAPSTRFYLEDQQQLATRWKTSLPFPVQVVARVEVIDHFSQGKQTKEFRYHHGYWDGAEREFRGFGMVEELDTEAIADYNAPRLHGDNVPFAKVEDQKRFSPPMLSKTWFHQGPIGDEFGEWEETDVSGEVWLGDPQMFARPQSVTNLLKNLPRRVRRDAVRTLRGSILRTELYALDGTDHQYLPYTVTEHLYGLREIDLPAPDDKDRLHIFFPLALAQRTTQWERGDDPMTQLSFTDDYDEFGQPRKQTQIACPRGWKGINDTPSKPYLATRSRTGYATSGTAAVFIVDRVAKDTSFEIVNDGSQHVFDLRDIPDEDDSLKIIGQSLNFYDGPAFTGLSFGIVGSRGALMRSESLVLTEEILHEAYKSGDGVQSPPETPPYLVPGAVPAWTPEYPEEFRALLPTDQVSDVTRPELIITSVGYGFANGSPGSPHARGYFVASDRRRYDFQDDPQGVAHGLTTAKRDALGRDVLIEYDSFDLLPKTVTDGVGLATSADYDYRVLQPLEVTDPNGNRTQFTFTPLGLPETIVVMGKQAEEGDTDAQPGTIFQYDFLAFDNTPPDDRQPVFVHSIKREQHRWDLIREENAKRATNAEPELTESEIEAFFPPDEVETFPERFIQSREYSDGFGRLLQTRTQAEDVIFGNPVFGGEVLPPIQGDPATSNDIVGQKNTDPANPNVVVSGWQIYDNKGRVVEKYEPFFAKGWDYVIPTSDPAHNEFGQKVTMFYDPRGQVIRTVNPDESEQRVIYGVPVDLDDPEEFIATPWEAYTYDANDNAGRTHPSESAGYQHHWNTPASAVVDALGRTIRAVARNRGKPGPGDPIPDIEEFVTRSTYDIRGNLLTVTDALGRLSFTHVYDLGNSALRIENIDAGIRRTILDAAGGVVEQRDSKGAIILHGYDILARPIRLWARDDANSAITLRERLEYGDGGDATQPAPEREANRLVNRLGKLHKHYDEAGLLTFDAYDIKGNLQEKARQVISDSVILAVFNATLANGQVEAFRVNWRPPDGTTLDDHASKLLDVTQYRTSLIYDALNRVSAMRYPEDVDGERKELRPRYNHAGALERVDLDGKTFVEHIAYSAKGQRALIAYGNGVMTRHAYDPQTFRLVRMRTERFQKLSNAEPTYHPNGTNSPLQDFAYEYDLAGNILRISDQTPGCGVINTLDGQDALNRAFAYDPLYRLLSATGRECKDIPRPRPWPDDKRCGFDSGNHGTPDQDNAPNLTAIYREDYAYDPAGNMLSMRHSNNGDSWTRHFGMGGLTPEQWGQEWPNHTGLVSEWMNPAGNRLTHVGDDSPTTPQSHFYDANGNLIRDGTSRHFEWDYKDRLRVFRTQAGNAEPSVYANYLYDASGQHVKKLVRNQGGQLEITVYVDGAFEHDRQVQGVSVQENDTLHVMDNQRRIAVVRVGHAFPDDTTPSVKFYLGDHLGSSNVAVDDSGSWINREEYTPYGETSFGSFAQKRHRFTGKERDEESGLYYHGARHYAPWVGRWVSSDPAGMVDGVNLYRYVRNNPMRLIDPSGNEGEGGGSPVSDNIGQEGSGPGTEPVDEVIESIDLHSVEEVEAQASLPPTPPVPAMSPRQARAAANTGAARYRRLEGMTDPEVQAGHTIAARHASESGIPAKEMNDPDTFQQLHSSRLDEGLEADVTNQQLETKTTTRHRAQEGMIDEAVDRVRAANGGKLTPEGQRAAAAEVRLRSENVPLDQRNVDWVRGRTVSEQPPELPPIKAPGIGLLGRLNVIATVLDVGLLLLDIRHETQIKEPGLYIQFQVRPGPTDLPEGSRVREIGSDTVYEVKGNTIVFAGDT